jgi:hypothetical protein
MYEAKQEELFWWMVSVEVRRHLTAIQRCQLRCTNSRDAVMNIGRTGHSYVNLTP